MGNHYFGEKNLYGWHGTFFSLAWCKRTNPCNVSITCLSMLPFFPALTPNVATYRYSLMTACILLGIEIHYSPYAWRKLQVLERMSLVVLIASILIASLFRSNSFASQESRLILESLIMTMNTAFYMYGIKLCVSSYYKHHPQYTRICRSCTSTKIFHRSNPMKHRDSIIFMNPMHKEAAANGKDIEMLQKKSVLPR